MDSFTAIDFETATAYHPCSVGIVTVENGIIVDEFVTLIKPPNNSYSPFTIAVHGIRPHQTINAKNFIEVFPEIRKSMALYGLDYESLNIGSRWECTVKIYRAKGIKPTKLSDCCHEMKIDLNHHEALSDARACAKLFLRK